MGLTMLLLSLPDSFQGFIDLYWSFCTGHRLLAIAWRGWGRELQPKRLSCFQEHGKQKLYCFAHMQIYMAAIEK